MKLNPEFQPSANELKALEAQVLYQEFENRLQEIDKKPEPPDITSGNRPAPEKDKIQQLEKKIEILKEQSEKKIKILEEQVKSLTELVLQKPPSYIYPVMPGYMSETREKPGEERFPQNLP